MESDFANHVAPALVRRHGIEQRGLAVEHANASGAVEFVPRECVEIAIQCLHIDFEVRHGLGPIDQYRNAPGMRQFDQVPHRVDRAKGVGEMGHCNQPGAGAKQALEFFQQQFARVVDRRHPQDGTRALARQLPRHDIGMVLHRADQDLVAGPQALSVTGRHQVDRLRGATHEHDLLAPGRMDQALHRVARRLVGIGRALAQGVHATMDVGIERGVVMCLAVDHALWLLAGGCVVQIDQRLAVDRLPQDGEIPAQPHDVQARGRGRAPQGAESMRGRAHVSTFTGSGKWPRKSVSSRVRKELRPSRLTISSAKAKVSRARAEASSSPRERR